MLIAVGKGIDLDVDVSRFNNEVRDHVWKIGLRNILMDSHANATLKSDPEGYLKKSRELVDKKLQSLYDGVVRAATNGGPKAPTDPVSQVILRLARKAVQKAKAAEIANAPKDQRLAVLNKFANEYCNGIAASARDFWIQRRKE